MDNNYCLILAGGNGTRLWPVSRTTLPKQVLDLLGTGRTMLQNTYERVSHIFAPDHIYISTNSDYLPIVHEQLPQVTDENILEEPIRRGTLAAVAWGTVVIAKQNRQANIFMTPSDHLILQDEAYRNDVLSGLDFVAKNEKLLVTGIRPSRPETDYGYIQMDESEQLAEGIYRVKSFTEKPNAEFAQVFIDEGDFLWNSGLSFFNVNVMLSNLYHHVPEYRIEIPRMMAEAETGTPTMVPEFFSSLPNLNIDISIMERSENVCVQQGHFGWADLGSWASLFDDAPSDEQGNVLLNSRAFLYDCQNNVIRLPNGRTAVIKGLKDYVIAEEGEILMICPREDVAAMRRMHTDTKFS